MIRTPYIILAQPRTASSNLVATLKKHPSILAKNEILYHPHYSYEKKLRRVIRTFNTNKKMVAGFKLMHNHVDLNKLKKDLVRLNICNRLKIIRLYRENSVDQVISWCVALKTNVWVLNQKHKTTFINKSSFYIYEIDVDNVIENMLGAIRAYDDFCVDFSKDKILHLNYDESLLPDGKEEVFSFLGVNPRRIRYSSNSLKKFNKNSKYRKMVINFKEIESFCINRLPQTGLIDKHTKIGE